MQGHTAGPQGPVVAVVAIEEDPAIRLTTNLVGCDAGDVVVGMSVQVTFEHDDDVWLPLFEPTGAPPVALPDEREEIERLQSVRPMATTEKFEDRVALTGIGMSRIGRKLMVPPLSLTVEAIRRAVADAGLTMDDIDGLSTYPATPAEGGYAEGGTTAVESVLGIRPTWHNGGHETPGATGSLIAAMLAVAAGLCRHVVCFRTVWQSTAAELAKQGDAAAVGWSAPGVGSRRAPRPVRRHRAADRCDGRVAAHGALRHHAGVARLDRAQRARERGAQPDRAVPRPAHDGRLPRGPTDVSHPSACSTATRCATAPSPWWCRRSMPPPTRRTRLRSRRSACRSPSGWSGTRACSATSRTCSDPPRTCGPARRCARTTSTSPSSTTASRSTALSWIEALGFCEIGEAKDFLDGGKNIARDGRLPLNTHGGQLSHGRTHGMGLVHEAVAQLRGDSGPRQVDRAATAIVTSGGLTPGSVLLLRRIR